MMKQDSYSQAHLPYARGSRRNFLLAFPGNRKIYTRAAGSAFIWDSVPGQSPDRPAVGLTMRGVQVRIVDLILRKLAEGASETDLPENDSTWPVRGFGRRVL